MAKTIPIDDFGYIPESIYREGQQQSQAEDWAADQRRKTAFDWAAQYGAPDPLGMSPTQAGQELPFGNALRQFVQPVGDLLGKVGEAFEQPASVLGAGLSEVAQQGSNLLFGGRDVRSSAPIPELGARVTMIRNQLAERRDQSYQQALSMGLSPELAESLAEQDTRGLRLDLADAERLMTSKGAFAGAPTPGEVAGGWESSLEAGRRWARESPAAYVATSLIAPGGLVDAAYMGGLKAVPRALAAMQPGKYAGMAADAVIGQPAINKQARKVADHLQTWADYLDAHGQESLEAARARATRALDSLSPDHEYVALVDNYLDAGDISKEDARIFYQMGAAMPDIAFDIMPRGSRGLLAASPDSMARHGLDPAQAGKYSVGARAEYEPQASSPGMLSANPVSWVTLALYGGHTPDTIYHEWAHSMLALMGKEEAYGVLSKYMAMDPAQSVSMGKVQGERFADDFRKYMLHQRPDAAGLESTFIKGRNALEAIVDWVKDIPENRLHPELRDAFEPMFKGKRPAWAPDERLPFRVTGRFNEADDLSAPPGGAMGEMPTPIDGVGALSKERRKVARQRAAWGKETTALSTLTPGKHYAFRFRVIDLEDIAPSHTDTLSPNPGYNTALQKRQATGNAVSDARIEKIAKELSPDDLLIDQHVLDRGAPIVDNQFQVLGGNHRVLALRRALQKYPENWVKYQEALKVFAKEHGVSPAKLAKMQNPVLVRETLEQGDLSKLAHETNVSAASHMSRGEKARIDAEGIDDTLLGLVRVGDDQTLGQWLGGSQDAVPFVRKFAGTLPDSELNTFANKQGGLSIEGMARMQDAVFAKLYASSDGQYLIDMATGDMDSNVKNATTAMYKTLGDMARLRQAVSSGRLDASYDIADDLASAVRKLAQLRAEKRMSAADYVRQGQMFGEGKRELTPTAEAILLQLDQAARSEKKMRHFVEQYTEMALAQADQGASSMFGAVGKEDLIERAGVKATTGAFADAPPPDLFGAGGGPEPPPVAPTGQVLKGTSIGVRVLETKTLEDGRQVVKVEILSGPAKGTTRFINAEEVVAGAPMAPEVPTPPSAPPSSAPVPPVGSPPTGGMGEAPPAPPAAAPPVKIPKQPRASKAGPTPPVTPTSAGGILGPEPAPAAPATGMPDWVQQTIKQDTAIMDHFGLTPEVERLAEQGMSAKQIAAKLEDRRPPGIGKADLVRMIRSVRSDKGIPSPDDVTAFDEWRLSRRAAPTPPSPPAPPSPPVGAATGVGASLPPASPGPTSLPPVAPQQPGAPPPPRMQGPPGGGPGGTQPPTAQMGMPPPIPPTTVRKGPLRPDEPGHAGNTFLKKYLNPATQGLITDLFNQAPPEVEEAVRRGVVSSQDLEVLASLSGRSVEQLVKYWKPGTTANAETLLRLRYAFEAQAQNVIRAKQAFMSTGPTNRHAAIAVLQEELTKAEAIREVMAGVTAEAGRALWQYKKEIPRGTGTQQLEWFLRKHGGNMAIDDLTELMARIDFTDPITVALAAREMYHPSSHEKAWAAFYFNLLSGPLSHVRNIVGNSLATVGGIVENIPAAGFDYALSLGGKRRERARYLGESGERLFGANAAAGELFSDLGQALRYASTGQWGQAKAAAKQSPLYEIARYGFTGAEAKTMPEVGAREVFTGKWQAIHGPSRMLRAADMVFSTMNQKASIYAQAYRKAKNFRNEDGSRLTGQELRDKIEYLRLNPTEDMANEAVREGAYRVFRDNDDKAKRALQHMWSQEKNYFRVLMPFASTPMNITLYTLERTPLAVPLLLAKRGGDAADLLGRMTLGTATTALLYNYAMSGDVMTGPMPDDVEERDAWRRQRKTPYSIKVGDRWFSYQPLQPYAALFAAAASAADSRKKGKVGISQDMLMETAFATARSMIDMPWTQGLSDALEALQDKELAGQFFDKTVPTFTVPATSAMRWLARAVDPTLYAPTSWHEQIRTNLPFAAGQVGPLEAVPPRVSAFGEPVTRSAEQMGLGAVSPFNISRQTDDPVEIELKRLEDLGLDVYPGLVGHQFQIFKEKMSIPDDVRRAYQTSAGTRTKAVLGAIMELPAYKSLSNIQKTEVINKLYLKIRGEAAKEYKVGLADEAVLQKIERYGKLREAEEAARK